MTFLRRSGTGGRMLVASQKHGCTKTAQRMLSVNNVAASDAFDAREFLC